MPVVCRNRPNRSRPRKLDAKAAARIICATLQERKPEPRLEQVASLRGLSPTIQFVRAVEEYAKNPNWTQADIEDELRERDCGWTPCEDRDPDCERKRRAAVAIAQQLIEGNNRTLAVAEAALQVFDIAVRIAIFAIKSLPWPPARLVGITLDRTATPALARVRTVVRAQRAANDDLFTLVANL
jgi:hypothetical protein